ncbi:hypothetical protein EVA_13481, partial [gut metagenome]
MKQWALSLLGNIYTFGPTFR